MNNELPITDITDGVLTITFNRPERLNALTTAIYIHIRDQVLAASASDDVSVVVLKGNGRAFSSGYDLKAQMSQRSMEQKLLSQHLDANGARWAIWNCRKPVVAAVHGYCLAGALELVLPTDFTISAESCKFGIPEILYGGGPAFNMFPWMMGHKKAKEIILMGEHFSARQAYEMGLVTKVVPDDDLDEVTARFVTRLKRMPRGALWINKQGLNRAYETAGMVPHINSWPDMLTVLEQMPDPTRDAFREKVLKDGPRAGIQFRDGIFDK
ncbi:MULTISPECIES: enoyl-CoA hydratase/isomerase family protein [Paraburkholderia]|jgi:Enoyl-CoA hydratase/carnithine racemase|uniref:enoyl-CoA hydratase/isomerase family protein n=1 Tax=Paraburkholderia TaxID=1822464 RepID=UPI00190A90FB|nr:MULTISPECIES: enoyl-CoA hydratase/isomerase family protein [Paraburkholderia]MBK3744988.1 enoyl-CoA hydratase/isomerase family protein [Paraburkholderia aspalathi]MBK5185869.1 enoyl-CoA hydratase/isomerase family protein [Burkholderia sp. R-69749]CAE6854498.1 1,4-dihydroxy-2-naphthoyl-CoA synthase [Paraburkholderia nemoris]CAE6896629.1 1,4-dihydroxy-2-naphthoyl-CoA synthase [Paraburkholderia domus]